MSEKKKSSLYASKETEKQLRLDVSVEQGSEAALDRGKDFEQALAELERVVELLEGDVKLEEALSLFDRGMQLSQHCEAFLKDAEQRIEILKRATDGSLSTANFEDEAAHTGV